MAAIELSFSQSRSNDEPEWRDEVWRRTQFEAYTAARVNRGSPAALTAWWIRTV